MRNRNRRSLEPEAPGRWTKIKPKVAPGHTTAICRSLELGEEDGSLFTLMSCHMHVQGGKAFPQVPTPQTHMYRDDEKLARSQWPTELRTWRAPEVGPKHSCGHADASTRCFALPRHMPGFAVMLRTADGRRHKTMLSPCWRQVEWCIWDLLFPPNDVIQGVLVRTRGGSALELYCDVQMNLQGAEPPGLVGQLDRDWEGLVRAHLAGSPKVPFELVAARRHEAHSRATA